MNRGSFRSQLDASWRILRTIKLDEHRNYHPNYPTNPANQFKNLSYIDIWKECIKNQYYDMQLNNNSFIQFIASSFNPLILSYSFYECPYECLSFEDFTSQHFPDLMEQEVGLRQIYEDYLTDCDLRESITPLRYDFYPEHYQEGLHPASHIHFGHSNNIRIATKKILKPVSFLLMIIRQYYPPYWIRLLDNTNASGWCNYIRQRLNEIDLQYWNNNDKREMHLN